jgi:hypothetical protein
MNTTKNTCRACNARRIPSRNSDPDAHGLELCRPCLDEAELENEHSDYGHDEPVPGCPQCGHVAPAPITRNATSRSVSTAEVAGLATCQGCKQVLPLKRFPTKRDSDGVYVRDATICRVCR